MDPLDIFNELIKQPTKEGVIKKLKQLCNDQKDEAAQADKNAVDKRNTSNKFFTRKNHIE